MTSPLDNIYPFRGKPDWIMTDTNPKLGSALAGCVAENIEGIEIGISSQYLAMVVLCLAKIGFTHSARRPNLISACRYKKCKLNLA